MAKKNESASGAVRTSVVQKVKTKATCKEKAKAKSDSKKKNRTCSIDMAMNLAGSEEIDLQHDAVIYSPETKAAALRALKLKLNFLDEQTLLHARDRNKCLLLNAVCVERERVGVGGCGLLRLSGFHSQFDTFDILDMNNPYRPGAREFEDDVSKFK